MKTNIGAEMLPFVIKDLATAVMRKKDITLEDALHYIYSSDLYRALQDEDAKMWYLSTPALLEILEKEKSAVRKSGKQDSRMQLYKVFCVENYSRNKKMTAEETLALFSKYGISDFLDETYETLHTQDPAYITDTIATYITHKKNCKK